jgi:hypothetical protein
MFLLITSIYIFYKKYTIEGNKGRPQYTLKKTIGEINKTNKEKYKNIILIAASGKFNELYKKLVDFRNKSKNNFRVKVKDVPKIKSNNNNLIKDFDESKLDVTVENLLKYLNANRIALGIAKYPK